MYQIMIVDDEAIIKNGLKNFIDWNHLDCQIISDVSNGLEAIDELMARQIDIVISDIRMPGLNGIELTEFIYNQYPKIKVILLTGYADFSFAQSAIKYGVVDFIIKTNPIDKIQDAVKKAKSLISQQREQESKIMQLEEEMNSNLPEVKRNFLHDVINRTVNTNDVASRERSLGINLQNYFVLLFETKIRCKSDLAEAAESNEEHLVTPVISFLTHAFKDYFPFIIYMTNEMICVIISFDQYDYSHNVQNVSQICDEIIDTTGNFMKVTLSVGISNLHNSIFELHSAYEEARKALSKKFYTGCRISYYLPDEVSSSPVTDHDINQNIQQLIKFMQLGDPNNAIIKMNEIVNQQIEGDQSIQKTKVIGNLLCSVCSNLLLNNNLYQGSIIENIMNKYSEITQCASIADLSEILIDMIKSVASYIGSNENNNKLIEMAIQYIEINYSRDIQLQTLANHVHLNGSYLSRLFKKETGETITEAITRCRVEKAKELLQKSEIKAYVVGSIVGINDSAYFSNVFKKYTGLSPKDYRSQFLRL